MKKEVETVEAARASENSLVVYLVEVCGNSANKLHDAMIELKDLKAFKKFCSMHLMNEVLNNENYDRYKCLIQTRNWRRNVEFDFYATHADVTDTERRVFAIVKGGSEAAELWGLS